MQETAETWKEKFRTDDEWVLIAIQEASLVVTGLQFCTYQYQAMIYAIIMFLCEATRH